jgi:ribonucleotide reductase beta subunit family protein with ferritin-like domain
MSKLAAFDDLLLQYKAFNYHDDAVLEQRLHDVQTWMKERIAQTHQDFFANRVTDYSKSTGDWSDL